MPFNTRNPIPSGDLRDLDDNARNIDTWANDKTKLSHPDRFGVERYTWHGIEQKAESVFASLGFFPPVDYATGLNVDSRNFTVTYNGVVYAAQPSAVPFTTGAWDAAQWYPIQNVLNQKNLLVFDTYAEASAAAATLPDGQKVSVEIDETRADRASSYNVAAGSLVFDNYLDRVGTLYAADFYIHGVTDQTEAFRACHSAANTLGWKVDYAGIAEIVVQADAKIVCRTSTDFAGATIRLLGGIQDPLTYAGGFNEAFIFDDPDAPFESVAGVFTAADLYAGSLFPTRGVFDGQGYALLTCSGFRVPNRAETGTQSYTQSFEVVRNGKATLPLSADLSAHAATCSIQVRRSSNSRLRIDGVVIEEGTWNKQRLLVIKRNNVDIGKFVQRYITDGGVPNVCDLIYLDNVADVSFDGIDGSGMQSYGISGTYLLNINGGAGIRLRDIKACTGWGWIGSNNVNGLYVDNCEVNRIDGHSSLHNVFVTGGALIESGVIYGWGGGSIKVKGSKIQGFAAVMSRNDYGGSFLGTIDVEGVDLQPNLHRSGVVDLGYTPVGAETTATRVYMPKSISVRGVKVSDGNPAVTNVDLVYIAIRHGTSVVVAPESIQISGVSVEGDTLTPRVTIPYGDMNREGGSTNSLKITDVKSRWPLSLSVPPPTRTPSIQCIVDIDLLSVSSVNASIQFEARYINCLFGVIEEFSTAGNPLLKIHGATLRNFGDSKKIGGAYAGLERWTGLFDCVVNGAFDFSTVSVLTGVTIVGSITPSLPDGVTRRIAFDGYNALIPA